jgi:hypothetical protein
MASARVSTDVKGHCAETPAIRLLWAVEVRQGLRRMSHVKGAVCRQHRVQGAGKNR